MNKEFSENDIECMSIALDQAKLASEKADYPIGAVLVIDDVIVDKTRNSINSQKNWFEHAEAKLIINNSKLIKKAIKKGSCIELFTTVEPCLMCMGLSVLHRITRITFACPDPHGGAAGIDPNNVNGEWYKENWPKIRSGILLQDSYEIMKKFISQKSSKNKEKMLCLFKQVVEDK